MDLGETVSKLADSYSAYQLKYRNRKPIKSCKQTALLINAKTSYNTIVPLHSTKSFDLTISCEWRTCPNKTKDSRRQLSTRQWGAEASDVTADDARG